MTLKNTLYSLVCAAVPSFLFGCTDETFFYDSEPNDSNSISFEAFAVSGSSYAATRSGDQPLLEPLVLSDASGESPLYLHTYVSDRIGAAPGETSGATTRANQITAADSLIKYHGSFKVLANLSASEPYFGWLDAKCSTYSSNIWTTDRREYWPGDRHVTFYAVSPSSAFGDLEGLKVDNGSMSFSYSAQKGNGENDAERQPDLLITSSITDKKGSDNGKAPLNFNHALAAVKFAIRDVANGEIEKITISGVKSKGDCELTYDPYSDTHSVSWTNQEGSESFGQNFNYNVSGLGAVDTSDASADILLNNAMPEKTFMMIPQQITDDAEIIVSVKRADMTPERIEVRGKINDNLVTEWKPGHEYIYTISTSKSNWVYVLQAYGNHNSNNGEHNVEKGNQIYVYSPSYAILDSQGRVESYPHDEYGDDAYFSVLSYRYHANDHSKIEPAKWVATHAGGEQYRVYGGKEELVDDANRKLTPEEWIPTRDALIGAGTNATDMEEKKISFATHHQITDWPGDMWMQKQNAYSGNSESKPWDLSKSGGSISRNTANCYVVDREGWYCFPLVYGNAIKNGKTNSDSYTYKGTGNANNINLVDYNGNKINSPNIPDNLCKSADIVWTDVYNTVSNVKLKTIGGEKMVMFYVNKFNLQQGSAMIAVYDSNNTVVWSWHIWITEHWLDPASGKPNAFYSGGKFSTYEAAEKSGWRQRGDLRIKNQYVAESYGYDIAPYNLGWCDPKNVDYLRRRSDMVFTQFTPEGKPTGKTVSIPVIQDGERVEYKFGNNTYYQWGRKDPIVGFVDHSQTVKRNFGNKKYELKEATSGIRLSEAIKNPQTMYYGADDWVNSRYFNLWNNGTEANKVVKTVYDPCPPGYSMPPAKMFEFVGPN
ncbi:MAG: fimbrillin family protein, partial [Muribaculaceae bacterium]|nr:fimbrillin family protein [Muribaculaceae bacterium]